MPNTKHFLFALLALAATACGNSPKADATAVCECFEKANAIPDENPARNEEQEKCSQLQLEKLQSYHTEDDKKVFMDAMIECSEKIMQDALENERL